MTYDEVDERPKRDMELGVAHEVDAGDRFNDGVLCRHVVHSSLIFLLDDLSCPHCIHVLVHQISEACISSSLIVSASTVLVPDRITSRAVFAIIRPHLGGFAVRSGVGNACLFPLETCQ